MPTDLAPRPDPRAAGAPRRFPWGPLLTALLVLLTLLGLGTWQIARRVWKHELVARVDARIHAEPVAPPEPARWAQVSARDDEYRRVEVRGHFLPERSTQVQALTDLGSGFWILTPMQDLLGHTILINRGFIAASDRLRVAPPPSGVVIVRGLLRLSESGGTWLRRNDPGAERWYARDVAAIGAARRLTELAPFFIDADAEPRASAAIGRPKLSPGVLEGNASGANVAREQLSAIGIRPVAGLTVTHFNDNHLIYALTWYTLALMVAGGMVLIVREPRRALKTE